MSSGYLGGQQPRRSAHREQMRTSVVDAALKLFLDRGHLAVRVEDIADEVGISRATFYKYFSERDEILAELFSRLLSERPDGAPGRGPAPERIRRLLVTTAEQMVQQEDLARFVYSVPLRHDALLPGRSGEPQIMKDVHELVIAGIKSGDLRDDVPADVLSHHIARTFEAAMREWATRAVSNAPERVEVLLSVAIDGIRG